MSCSEMCKQLWALSQVQGVQCAVFSTHCTVHTPRTPRTPSAPHTGAHVRSSMSDPQFPLSSLSGFQLPSDQRPPLIRDVCLPWRRVRVTTEPRLREWLWVRLRVRLRGRRRSPFILRTQ